MRKYLYYGIVAVMFAVVCTGCESHRDEPDYLDPNTPTIDPPVNELLRKDPYTKIHDKKLKVYGYEADSPYCVHAQSEWNKVIIDTRK